MRWICYDERETFSIEAKNLEQAKQLASVYEAKVLGPSKNFQAGNKTSGSQSSAQSA